ncbi:MAG: hypothetical protein WAU02_00085 [Candidatus Saccharimonadales bacterium]
MIRRIINLFRPHPDWEEFTRIAGQLRKQSVGQQEWSTIRVSKPLSNSQQGELRRQVQLIGLLRGDPFRGLTCRRDGRRCYVTIYTAP